MYTYEVLYSRLNNGNLVIRLICLGKNLRRFKFVLSDYGFAGYVFNAEESMDQLYAKYFDKVCSRYKAQRKKKKRNFPNELNTETFISAITLASRGEYTYISAVNPDYKVPCLSSGREISEFEIKLFFKNFPAGNYASPKKLLETYEVILLL